MSKKIGTYITSSAILAGTILGVGIFGLPNVISRAGFLPGIIFLVIACLLNIWAHLIYGEALMRTDGDLRGPGLAKIYLGKKGFIVSIVESAISSSGVMLAYLILGSQFTHNLFHILGWPISLISATMIFWFLGVVGMSFGIKFVGISEIIGLVLITILIFVFFGIGLPGIESSQLKEINFSEFFLPYGILLFALSSFSAIPEILSYFKKKKVSFLDINFKLPFIIGTIIPAVLSLFFILGILGIFNGSIIAANPVPDLLAINPTLGLFTSILGIVLIITSFFINGLNIKNTIIFDFKASKFFGWSFAIFLPLILYLLGISDFIAVIGFLGAVMLGIKIILLVMIHHQSQKFGKSKTGFSIRLPLWLKIVLTIVLLTGIIMEIVYIF